MIFYIFVHKLSSKKGSTLNEKSCAPQVATSFLLEQNPFTEKEAKTFCRIVSPKNVHVSFSYP